MRCARLYSFREQQRTKTVNKAGLSNSELSEAAHPSGYTSRGYRDPGVTCPLCYITHPLLLCPAPLLYSYNAAPQASPHCPTHPGAPLLLHFAPSQCTVHPGTPMSYAGHLTTASHGHLPPSPRCWSSRFPHNCTMYPVPPCCITAPRAAAPHAISLHHVPTIYCQATSPLTALHHSGTPHTTALRSLGQGPEKEAKGMGSLEPPAADRARPMVESGRQVAAQGLQFNPACHMHLVGHQLDSPGLKLFTEGAQNFRKEQKSGNRGHMAQRQQAALKCTNI